MLSADGLEITLAVAAFLAGLTGTWSPCGFSMIATIGPAGHRDGRATTLAACITFIAGALIGGVLTFGILAALGGIVHGAGGELAYLLAAAIAAAAAFLEARSTPIAPQVRRQLPEHWRRLIRMPFAAALYGILLGLGFTTFVLTFGVFALAGIAFAIGEPQVGLLVGLAFGAGRALPVALTAPFADRPAGIRVTELMSDRPGILRGFRLGDAVALTACSAALLVTVPAGAAKVEQAPGADPAISGDATAYQLPSRAGVLVSGGQRIDLPGNDPALGDGRAAVISGGEIVILRANDLSELGRVPAAGVDAVAISGRWLVWRARVGGRDLIRAREIADPARPGPERVLARVGGSAQLGRPSVDGNKLVYARADARQNVIVKVSLAGKGGRAVLMRSVTVGLSNPTIRGSHLLYVRHTRRTDQLKLAGIGGRDRGRTLLARRHGTLWSTALGADRAYVTHLARGGQRILSVAR